ncbi:CU044_2847 family protein [Streptomyces sp. NPDC006012]|uniref:CU044_2847 family protein n=1 Tax=Streptomyces sp. NPDC006012 TaxID=3364739 RepID=UPI0036D1D523
MGIVEVPLDDGSGGVVRVQIRERDDALVPVGRGSHGATRAVRSFGQLLDTVRPVAESFVERLGGMRRAPDEVTVQFGVSLSAEADVVIASTATEANFSVSLTWNRSDAAAAIDETDSGS